MKITIRIAAVLLLICLVSGLSGCRTGDIKDNILDGYDDLLQFVSSYALTKESKLQGEKIMGEDAYAGSYNAEYKAYNGEEYIFGATGLEREAGNALTAAYTLKITSGSASLIWIHSGSKYTIANTEGEDSFKLTIGSGDNYIVLVGEDFTGSLELEVK